MQGKIHPLPRDKVKKILEHNGFVWVKGRGPHMKYKKYDGNGACLATTLVSHCPNLVPFHIRNIIRQSKKPEEEFY